jgi:hypothetical protein
MFHKSSYDTGGGRSDWSWWGRGFLCEDIRVFFVRVNDDANLASVVGVARDRNLQKVIGNTARHQVGIRIVIPASGHHNKSLYFGVNVFAINHQAVKINNIWLDVINSKIIRIKCVQLSDQ